MEEGVEALYGELDGGGLLGSEGLRDAEEGDEVVVRLGRRHRPPPTRPLPIHRRVASRLTGFTTHLPLCNTLSMVLWGRRGWGLARRQSR